MKIKQYTSQQGISALQVRPTQIADPIDLSQAINFVENRYEQGVREQEKERKLFYANEVARTQLALDEEYANASEAIKNGDYGAAKNYNKFYDGKVREALGRLSDYDPELSEAARIDFERTGMRNGLRLKSSVRSRIKADASNSYKSRRNILITELSNAATDEEAKVVLGEIARADALAESSGVLVPGGGALATQDAFNQSVDFMIDRDPGAFIADQKANPSKYKGIRSIGKKVDYAKRLRFEKEEQDKALSILAEMSADEEVFEQYQTGVVDLKGLMDGESEVSKLVADSVAKRAVGEKPSRAEVVKIRESLAAQNNALFEAYFDDNGNFNFSKRSIEDIRDFNRMVYAASPELTKSEMKTMLSLGKQMYQKVSEAETGKSSIIKMLPGIQDPYGVAMKKINSHVSNSLDATRDVNTINRLQVDYLESFSSLYEHFQSVGHIPVKSEGIAGEFTREVSWASKEGVNIIADMALQNMTAKPPNVRKNAKLMTDPVSGVQAYVFPDGSYEVVE